VASSGEFVTFLDDDDLRVSGSLDSQIQILDQTPEAMMIYGQAIPEDAGGERRQPYPRECPQGDIFWELLIRNFIPSGSVVFRRACISQIGLLDASIPGSTTGIYGSASRRSFRWPRSKLRARLAPINGDLGPGQLGYSDLIERGRRRFRGEWCVCRGSPTLSRRKGHLSGEHFRKTSPSIWPGSLSRRFGMPKSFGPQEACGPSATAPGGRRQPCTSLD
jgi:hypothetical protein